MCQKEAPGKTTKDNTHSFFVNHLLSISKFSLIVVSAGAVYFTKLFVHPSVIIRHKTHQISSAIIITLTITISTSSLATKRDYVRKLLQKFLYELCFGRQSKKMFCFRNIS